MRISLSKYGWPQVVVLPLIIIATMITCAVLIPSRLITLLAEAILASTLILALAFFRDPHRCCPQGSNLLLAPADGRITDIETVQENDFIKGTALRIGIFLSIFDLHINRMPCKARVEKTTYKKGNHKNAMYPQSARANESNDLSLVRTEQPADRLIVRQISGAIARRIVCHARQGQELAGGTKFGMIKYGSRTELYVPARPDVKCIVKIGDKVKAGITVMARYEECQD